jgi:Phytanoyl-CoA dioxygenase (PhyH)
MDQTIPAPAPTWTLADFTEPAPPEGPLDWNAEGVAIHRAMFDHTRLEAYRREWKAANGYQQVRYPNTQADAGTRPLWLLEADHPGGWDDCTPYMRYSALRDLVCAPELAEALERLTGEPMAVHLNLTGWVTTERDWHQDTYLNPPEVGDYYAAVWIALGPVHPDSGPFQYVPGSHRWHTLTRDRIGRVVDLGDPAWPKHTEDVLSPLVADEITRRHAHLETYLPDAGDVLIWHGRLYHRGSRANVPGAYRPALIAHYSGVNHRPDMPAARQHGDGGWYFPLNSDQPVR